MAFLAAIPVAYAWVAAGLSAAATVAGGVAANKQAKSQASQLQHQADVEQAGAQRAAVDERRTARLVSSRAISAAASSGAGVSDPTVTGILADIGTEGEYRALTALYSGDETARSQRLAASNIKAEGKTALYTSYLKAGASLFGTGASMYAKYGGAGLNESVSSSSIYKSQYPI